MKPQDGRDVPDPVSVHRGFLQRVQNDREDRII